MAKELITEGVVVLIAVLFDCYLCFNQNNVHRGFVQNSKNRHRYRMLDIVFLIKNNNNQIEIEPCIKNNN